jgi:hypothetical protein
MLILLMGVFFKYTVEMASDGMICVPRCMKIGLRIQVICIKDITSTIWGAAVLVLLMGRIYDLCRWDDLRRHDTYIPSFMKIDSGIQVILRVLLEQLEKLWCLYYRWEGFLKYAIEMTSGGMTYMPSFMKIGAGVHAMLRFCLRNRRRCNVGITDKRDLWIPPLRWAQVP